MQANNKRMREECTCGCDGKSIWNCYNTSLDALQSEAKRLKFSTADVKKVSREFSLQLVFDNSNWTIHPINADSLEGNLPSLAPKQENASIQEEFDMLEQCELTELEPRVVHYLYTSLRN